MSAKVARTSSSFATIERSIDTATHPYSPYIQHNRERSWIISATLINESNFYKPPMLPIPPNNYFTAYISFRPKTSPANSARHEIPTASPKLSPFAQTFCRNLPTSCYLPYISLNSPEFSNFR